MSDLKPSTGEARASIPEPPNSRTAEQPNAPVFIPATVVAELLGVSRRGAAKRCMAEAWQHRYVSTPESRGRRLEIALSALPEAVQIKYLQSRGPRLDAGIGFWGLGARDQSQPPAPSPQPPTLRAESREPRGENRSGRDQQTGLTVAESRESAREKDRETEIQRVAVLDALETYCQAHVAGRNRTRAITDFLTFWNAAHPEQTLSRATLYEWMRRRRESGNILPAYAHGPQGSSMPPEIDEMFRAVYMTRQRLSVAVCRQLVVGQLTLAKSLLVDQVPSAGTLHQLVRSLPLPARILAREGEDAFRRKCEPTMERDYTQIAVMGCWVADHYTFKQFVRGEKGRPVRPVKTEWMDMRSRRRVGWCIEEIPSQETVLAALAMGVTRFGIPQELYTDNGREFSATTVAGKSRRFRVRLDEARVRALTEHLGVIWHFSIPKRPEGRGMIERAFGVDLDRFDRLGPAFTGRGPEDKPEGLADVLKKPELLPTLQEFREQYARYAEGVANAMPHEGHGMDGRSPREVFESEPYVKRTATQAELRLMFMRPSKPATVQARGIEAFGGWYWSEAIAPRLGQRLYYRYEPTDLSTLNVFTFPEDQYICTLRRRDRAGATTKMHKEILHDRKAAKRAAKLWLNHEKQSALVPDPLAAMAAAARASHEPRATSPEGPGPDGGERAAKPGGRIVEIVRTPFRGVIEAAEAEEQRHAVRARMAEEELRAESREPRAERTKKPSRADLSDEAIEMLGRRDSALGIRG